MIHCEAAIGAADVNAGDSNDLEVCEPPYCLFGHVARGFDRVKTKKNGRGTQCIGGCNELLPW